MAVNLSPIWGAGAQLLDNSGNVLSGGKIYTYAAGTTTQVATYTSNTGITANSNPIVLNSAGRVPYEIWLTDGQNYKFVLKDSNDVLIGTWDNLSGINSNFVAYTNQQEIQTATAGQTVFNLTTMQYIVGTNSLSVFVDGVNQYGPGAQYAYEETDSNTVTFASGLHVGAEVKFTSTQTQNAGVIDASQVGYTYPATDAVSESVEERLAQYVSVKDFGAVGDGVTDDTTAIQNAYDTLYTIANGVGTLFFPKGVYLTTGLSFNCANVSLTFVGDGLDCTVIKKTGSSTDPVVKFYTDGSMSRNIAVSDMEFNANNVTNCAAVELNTVNYVHINNVKAWKGLYGFKLLSCLVSTFENCTVNNNYVGINADLNEALTPYNNHNTIRNCVINGNTLRGISYGYGMQLYVQNCDIEGNGQEGVDTTGGIYIYSTIQSEVGLGQVFVEDCWLEANQGYGIYCEGASGGELSVKNTLIAATASGASAGNCIYTASGLRRLTLSNLQTMGGSGTVVVNSENLFLSDCLIPNISNGATNYSIFQLKTSALDSLNQIKTTTPGSTVNVGTNTMVAKNLPKALCLFDGSASSPITPSFSDNVINITKNSTGNYTVNINTAFTWGPVNITALDIGGNSVPVRYLGSDSDSYSFLCTNLSGTAVDPDTISFVAYGTF